MQNKIGVKETSELLGVSKKTIYKKLRTGQIPGKKVETKYGMKWVIDKNQLEEQARINREVVEVKEVNKPVSKEVLLDELIEAVNSKNEALINEVKDNITDKLDRQEKAIKELTEEVKELKNRTFLDKIKDIFQ